ncbi:Ger(x)C family spore germination protein [Halobacillus litoralis]|uniref:Ger(X)C family spore germination protein n=1 Tax=Halobacillus litoralis TaxID=45668 RepID=A0A845E6P0_9BACI|nr:Ger(x)C family spore germination protein [Halobacillus litoralis]MYL51437.1 Ger(x)C family spore germination protein [Halobacillus litoralis]
MKTMKLLLTSLLLLGLLSGCWDTKELNEVAFVTGVAIEQGEDAKYKVTVGVANASQLNVQKSEGNTPSVTFSLEGNSISELLDKMNVGLTRELRFSHTRTLVIGEEVAREGIAGFLDYLERSGQFRNNFTMLVAKNISAADILKTTFPIQKIPSLKIHNQSSTLFKEWGGAPDMKLSDFIAALSSKGRHPVAEALTIVGSPEQGGSVDNNKKLDPESLITLVGLAVFKEDKLIGYLNLEETRNYVWTQDLIQTTLTVPCGEEKYIDVRIVNSKSSIHANYNRETPNFQVEIIAEALLNGTQCRDDLEKVDTYKKFEKDIEVMSESMILNTVTKVQEEYEVDIFGFGEAMRRQHYQRFQAVKDHWDEEFSKADIDITVNIFLRRAGTSNKSFLTEDE